MTNTITTKEGIEIPKNMVFKILKLMFWSAIGKLRLRRGYYLPRVPEIKAEKLNERLASGDRFFLLDLRIEEELEKDGYIEGSAILPFLDFQSHIDKFPKDEEIVTICPGGGASLISAEILIKSGFEKRKVRSLRGGIRNWKKKGFPLVEYKQIIENNQNRIEEKKTFLPSNDSSIDVEVNYTLNVQNLLCPRPVLESRKAIKQKVKIGQVLEILTTDPGSLSDIPAWAVNTNQELIFHNDLGGEGYRFLVRRLY